MSAAPVLELDHVSAVMRMSWSIDDISLTVGPGEMVAFVGANGSGKGLALRVAAGLEAPASGQVRLLGLDPYQVGPEDHRELRQRMGIVFDHSALISNMTVFENVGFPLRYHTLLTDQEIESRVMEALEAWGVEKLRHHFPADLNLGHARQVGLARALVLDPDIIFIQEMLAGFDAQALLRLKEFFQAARARRKQTVVVSANAPTPLLDHMDRLFFFRHGQLVATGKPTELARSRDPAVQEMLSL